MTSYERTAGRCLLPVRRSVRRPVRRSLMVIVVGSLVVVSIAACSPASSVGYVVGKVALCAGGPSTTAPKGLTRIVILKQGGHGVQRRVVGKPFRFRFTVHPGSYLVLAEGDRPVSVRVSARQTVTVRPVPACHLVG